MDLFRSSTFMSTTCNFLQYWLCTMYQKATLAFSAEDHRIRSNVLSIQFYVQLLFAFIGICAVSNNKKAFKNWNLNQRLLAKVCISICIFWQNTNFNQSFFTNVKKFYLLRKFSFNPTYVFFQNLSVTNLLFHVSCLFGVSSKHQQTGSESIQAMYCSQIFQIVFLGQNENDCIVTITTTRMDLERLFRVRYTFFCKSE